MDRAVGELPVAEQVSSVFADVCRAELVGRTVKMAREVLNDSEVGAPGGIGEVTTLEFVEHHLSKMGHKNLLETRPYRPQRANGSVVAREASAASASFKGYYRKPCYREPALRGDESTNPAILKSSTFRFPFAGWIFASRKITRANVAIPVPETPNLLVSVFSNC